MECDPDTEVLITAGATEAIDAAQLALLEPGDEVIAFEPIRPAERVVDSGDLIPLQLSPGRT
jgi:N-succinyldiaminopimelate aminotransferase